MSGYWPRIAVGAIVLKNNEVLLVKRRYPPAPNRWSIPGGHVEPGEELHEAVLRELEEETGLKGSDPQLLAITEYIAHDNEGRLKYHYVIIDFKIREFCGELRPNEEVLGIGFFNIYEALKLKLTVTTKMLLESIVKGAKPTPFHIIYREVLKGG